MEVLALGSSYAERLLHKPIRLVSVSLGFTVWVLVTKSATVRCPAIAPARITKSTSSLAFHFSVGQEATRHPACTP